MRATEFTDNLEIKNTVDTSFRGGYDATLYVIKDDQQVAYLQYSVYKDSPAIKMIWVSPNYRRQKIAYRMLKELQSMFPNEEIDWGYTTADGTQLKASVPFTKRPNPEIIKKRTKLTAVHSKLRQLNYRLEKLQQDNPEKARAFVATVGDRWNKLNDLAYRLENELYGAKGEYSKFIAENSDDDLVSEFLKSISPRELRYYSIRDNCGPAALDMMYWAKKKGIDLTKHGGFFVADHVVYDKADFTKEMKIEFKHSGLDFNNPDDRKQFIETNPKYSEEWKKIPHFWLQDAQGNIYDPSGYIQFVKTGLSSDLDKSRYQPAKQGVAEGKLVESIVEYHGLTMDVKIDGANVDIRALDGGKQIGYVVFDRDGDRLIALDLSVNREFQRQKIATKMYDYVKSLGFIIYRSPNQLSRGKLFWDNSRGEKVKVWENKK